MSIIKTSDLIKILPLLIFSDKSLKNKENSDEKAGIQHLRNEVIYPYKRAIFLRVPVTGIGICVQYASVVPEKEERVRT